MHFFRRGLSLTIPYFLSFWHSFTRSSSSQMDQLLSIKASTPTCAAPNDWPRNGTVLQGSWVTDAKGDRWAKFVNGMYLPEKQAGFVVLFEQK